MEGEKNGTDRGLKGKKDLAGNAGSDDYGVPENRDIYWPVRRKRRSTHRRVVTGNLRHREENGVAQRGKKLFRAKGLALKGCSLEGRGEAVPECRWTSFPGPAGKRAGLWL